MRNETKVYEFSKVVSSYQKWKPKKAGESPPQRENLKKLVSSYHISGNLKNGGRAIVSLFYAQGRTEEFAAYAACAPRGE